MRGYDAWLTTDPRMDEPDILVPGDEFYPRCKRDSPGRDA